MHIPHTLYSTHTPTPTLLATSTMSYYVLCSCCLRGQLRRCVAGANTSAWQTARGTLHLRDLIRPATPITTPPRPRPRCDGRMQRTRPRGAAAPAHCAGGVNPLTREYLGGLTPPFFCGAVSWPLSLPRSTVKRETVATKNYPRYLNFRGRGGGRGYGGTYPVPCGGKHSSCTSIRSA